MKVIKKLITFFLIGIIAFSYLYFFTYNLYVSLKQKTFNSNYYLSDIKINEELKNSSKFKFLSNKVYSDAVKYVFCGTEKYNSSYILNLVDKNLDTIVMETSRNFSKEQIRTDSFLYLSSMYEDITSNKHSVNFYLIDEIFSYSILEIILLTVCVCLFLLFIFTNKFVWIKNNAFVLMISSFSFTVGWYLVGLILSFSRGSVISCIFLSIFKVINNINLSYCSIFFVLGILSLIVYFSFFRLFNIKKHSI